MTIKEIVQKHLEENGYDGLWLPGYDCGCFLADFMPCEEPGMECEAGHKVPCDQIEHPGAMCIGRREE
jgi:hypothetical protein